jgi:hypothetical protein
MAFGATLKTLINSVVSTFAHVPSFSPVASAVILVCHRLTVTVLPIHHFVSLTFPCQVPSSFTLETSAYFKSDCENVIIPTFF